MSNALWNMAYAHLQAENTTLKAKTESLEEYKAASLEYTSGLEEYARGLEAKLWAMEGAAREAADNLVDARESLKFGSHEYICAVAAHDVLRDALGDPHPAKGEEGANAP